MRLDVIIQDGITQRVSDSPTGNYLGTLTNYAPVAYEAFPSPAGGFVWNTNCWAADLDWSGIGTYAEGQYWFHATLISPRHVIAGFHSGIGPDVGDTIYFIKSDTTVYEAEVESVQRVGSTDFNVAYLVEDVPSDIPFYKVVPSNYDNYLSYDPTDLADITLLGTPDGLWGKPLIVFDKERKATIGRVYNITQNVISTLADDYTYTNREAYWEGVVTGDSGAPNFLLVDRELLLAGTNYSGSAVVVSAWWIGVASTIAAINAAMTTLDAGDTGYQLTLGDLSTPSALKRLKWPARLVPENEDDVEAVSIALAGLMF